MSRPCAVLDIECLIDFFEIKLRESDTGVTHGFPLYPGSPPLDLQALVNLLARFTIYTFNGNNYDLPMLTLALHGATHQQMLEGNNAIIKRGLKRWQFYRAFNIEPPAYIDHVDLFDVAPGVSIGLKMYMGRIHAPKMQDMPVDYDVPVLPMERLGISRYCDNDLEGTNLLREGLWERLDLRCEMSERYGTDLRSKSDAQIAEAVIKAQLAFAPEPRYVPHGFTFKYEPPAYIRFATAPMQAVLQRVQEADFYVSDKEEAITLGHTDVTRTGVRIPAALAGMDIRIGHANYRLGIGGLHSQESSVYYLSVPGSRALWDVDVTSYYPSLIDTLGMYPQQLGPGFLDIYRGIKSRRIAAKNAGQMTESDGLKIVLNGTFGKLFSKWSCLYAPELGIRVTMTGQLALLMLIEMMELSGIRVVSANTDGIVLLIPHGYDAIATSTVEWWERTTGLGMEYSHYAGVFQRDVNNYIALPMDPAGKVKRKGVFAPGGLLSGPQGKHPDKDICADAVVAYLKDGTPVGETIRNCTDIRKFLQIRHCTKGAIDLPAGVAINDGKYLGKAVRWYYSGRPGYIGAKGTGDKVAGSEGATPIMELPASLPADIDYQHYIRVALEMLKDLGVSWE